MSEVPNSVRGTHWPRANNILEGKGMKYLKFPFKNISFPEEFTILCLLSSTEQTSLDKGLGKLQDFLNQVTFLQSPRAQAQRLVAQSDG